MKYLAQISFGLLLATTAAAQTVPASINFKDPAAVAALRRELASDDFARRDRAQALVDNVPLSARDDLAKLAETVTDFEAQSRLKARVEMLDDMRVTTVPGISLALKDATLKEVAAALAGATGQPFTTEPGAPAGGAPYTLSAKEMLFWEIQQQLNAQSPIWFNTGVNDIRVNRSTMNWRDVSMTRGMAVFLQEIKAPPAARGTAPNNRYTTTLALGIDPRICILQLKPPEFGPVNDNAKNRWTATATSAAVSTISLGRGITFSRPITLEPAGASVGKTIPSLRGVFPIVVQSAVESMTIDPAKDALGVPVVMGNVEISVTKCSVTENGGANANVAFDLVVHVAPGKNDAAFPIGPVAVNILDAAGKTVIVRTLPLGFIGSMSNSFSLPAAGPLTMRLDVTTAVREVKVPFEFKGVPVP